MKVCATADCDERSYCRNLCRRHYEALPDIRGLRLARERERYHRRKNTPGYKAAHSRAKSRYVASEKGRAKAAEDHRKWREAGGVEWMKNYQLDYRYGITLDEWRDLFAAQGERCAICRSDEHRGRGWHVDHDHACCPGGGSCGKCIRGILCSKCNSGIGLLGDDPERLQVAIDYLTSRSSRATP